MTLATHIAVTKPVPAEDLYKLVDDMVRSPGRAESIAYRAPGKIHNRIGQGNASMLDIEFAADGESITAVAPLHDEYRAELAEDGVIWDDVWEGWYPPVDYFATIGLDTAYGYRGPNGQTCSMLHGSIIIAVFQFALGHGAGIVWRNEFTGTWHDGLDGLDGLVQGGVDAVGWYENTIVPVIAAMTDETEAAAAGETP